jgi:peptidoglycan/LPS O-acetylase OafA/YrhL
LRAFTFWGPTLAPLANLLGGFDGFAYGAILVLVYESTEFSARSLKKYSLGCVLLTLAFLIFGFRFGITTRQQLLGEMFLPSIIYLIASALIGLSLSRSGSKQLKVLSRGFLPHWGKLSYAAYLCHYPIPEVVNKIFSWHPQIYAHYFSFEFACLQFGLGLLGTYVVSWLLHRYVELPFLKLKNREAILFEPVINPQY